MGRATSFVNKNDTDLLHYVLNNDCETETMKRLKVQSPKAPMDWLIPLGFSLITMQGHSSIVNCLYSEETDFIAVML